MFFDVNQGLFVLPGKDGHYFLELCVTEGSRLLNLADEAEVEAQQPDLSEEVKGKLRAAYGKARLLVSQKLEQFKGLCANNINQVSDYHFCGAPRDGVIKLQISNLIILTKIFK